MYRCRNRFFADCYSLGDLVSESANKSLNRKPRGQRFTYSSDVGGVLVLEQAVHLFDGELHGE